MAKSLDEFNLFIDLQEKQANSLSKLNEYLKQLIDLEKQSSGSTIGNKELHQVLQ